MSKNILGLFALLLLVCSTGCFDIIEEVTLNKDGSGKFKFTMDFQPLLNSAMKDMAKRGIRKEFGSADGEKSVELDSAAFIYDIISAESKALLKEPDFWKKVLMSMKISESDNIFQMSFAMDFTKPSDIDEYIKNSEELNEVLKVTGDNSAQIINLGQSFKGTQLFEFKKRTVKRFKQRTLVEQSEENEMLAKKMEMGATYKTIYTMPCKIKKASHPKAIIEGKTVTVEVPLMDYTDGKISLENKIKFKKK